jgi:predicted Fe-Mo cluster-binding NifX family protein
MKIAIGTDDKKMIRNGHFCQSRYYLVIEFFNGEIVSREYRRSPYNVNKKRQHYQRRVEKILELLGDCSLFMAKSMRKTSLARLTDRGIDCIISEIELIEQAIELYLYGGDEAFQYYDARKEALSPCSERMIKTVSR